MDVLKPGGDQPRRALVIGGARSGKSAYAESLLPADGDVVYVATAAPYDDDPDWQRRVAEHRERRPTPWRTVETADPASVVRTAGSPVLVDCVSAWLTRVLDECGAWDGLDQAALGGGRARMDDFSAAWQECRVFAVAVTSEVGLGVVPETAAGRLFRDELGRLNARLAALSDDVWLVTAGLPLRLK